MNTKSKELKVVVADLRHLYWNLCLRTPNGESDHDKGLVGRCINKLEDIISKEDLTNSPQ